MVYDRPSGQEDPTAADVAHVAIELLYRLWDDDAEQPALQWLTRRCVELFAVRAAGVLLVDDDGAMGVAAASDAAARGLQTLATASGEGPGPACCRSGASVVVHDLGEVGAQWPRYVRRAREAGVGAVCSLPLRQRQAGRPVGALNLFRPPSPDPLPRGQMAAAHALADAAALGLAQRRTRHATRLHIGQLTTALTSRIRVEQAKGALAERWQGDVDTAFAVLRRYARVHQMPIDHVARAVVERRAGADPFA